MAQIAGKTRMHGSTAVLCDLLYTEGKNELPQKSCYGKLDVASIPRRRSSEKVSKPSKLILHCGTASALARGIDDPSSAKVESPRTPIRTASPVRDPVISRTDTRPRTIVGGSGGDPDSTAMITTNTGRRWEPRVTVATSRSGRQRNARSTQRSDDSPK